MTKDSEMNVSKHSLYLIDVLNVVMNFERHNVTFHSS